MKIDISRTDKFRVATLQCNLPYSYQEILHELENEKWSGQDKIQKVSVNDWDGGRHKLWNPESQKLQEIKEFLGSEEWKMQWIEWMFNNIAGIDSDWGWRTPADMAAHSYSHGEFTKDMPGFVNCLHTDFRPLISTGMIYFSEDDDANLSSYFYDTFQRDNPMRIPTNFGSGWIHLNGNDTWHEGYNKTENIRYSMLLGLTVNIQQI